MNVLFHAIKTAVYNFIIAVECCEVRWASISLILLEAFDCRKFQKKGPDMTWIPSIEK